MRSYALNKLFRHPSLCLALYFSSTQAKCRGDFACGVHDLQFVQPMCVFIGSGSLHFPLWYNQCEVVEEPGPAEAWPGSWGVKRDWQWRFWEETPNDLDFLPKHWDQDKGQEWSKAYTVHIRDAPISLFPTDFWFSLSSDVPVLGQIAANVCFFFNACNWFKKNKKFNKILSRVVVQNVIFQLNLIGVLSCDKFNAHGEKGTWPVCFQGTFWQITILKMIFILWFLHLLYRWYSSCYNRASKD